MDVGDPINMLQPMQSDDNDDILKYLLVSDDNSPSSDFSSPDGSPMLVLDESSTSPDSSPWRTTDDAFSAVPGLPDVSIDFNSTPDLLMYGSTFDAVDYSFPLNNPPPNVPVSPLPVSPVPGVSVPSSPVATSPPMIAPKKVSRSKKRPRVSEPPPVPSPEQPDVALSREKLLQISSQGMERYVENLSSSRALSLDDQKELKRQKRLIKNRESAQLSRERKRAYIDQLEERISQLVNENTLLKNENTSLRQALSQYQTVPSLVVPKAEVVVSGAATKDPLTVHATKMAGLITNATTIGGNRQSSTAKAGVCLLIVLFTFGLFMNSTTNGPRGGVVLKNPLLSDSPVPVYHDRSIGYKRSILEVLDEDDDYFEDQRQLASESSSNQLVIPAKTQRPIIQHPIKITPAGIYKLSYSPEPARFLPTEPSATKGQNNNDEKNSTYMLFLDPRPDLDNDGIPDSEQTDLQVSTHSHVTKKNAMDAGRLPPMIISLVVPPHIANGSNPLFPKDKNGYFSTDSLMELTCQVMDVSITTSERPQSTAD